MHKPYEFQPRTELEAIDYLKRALDHMRAEESIAELRLILIPIIVKLLKNQGIIQPY